jgi:hypothetical protein
MQLFSKRYDLNSISSLSPYGGLRQSLRRCSTLYSNGITSDRVSYETAKFLHTPLKTRLEQEIKFIIGNGDSFLESFLIVDNQVIGKKHFHTESLKNLSLRELGYDITEYYETKSLAPKEDCKDIFIFDLIELIIIFTKLEERDKIVSKFNRIFKEEGNNFEIYNFMIVEKERSDIRTIIPLIKDETLKNKLIGFYFNRESTSSDFQIRAKTSAELLQYIFSSPIKTKTKTYTEDLCKKLSEKYTNPEKASDLEKIINDTVKNAKSLNNEVADIRHTDQSTIPIVSGDFYKLISIYSIQLVELVILTFPEEYIFNFSPEEIKDSYLDEYKVDKDGGWIVSKKIYIDEINVQMPF